jgi:glycosyltransferase involved in cell wall biosynthesis
VAALRLAAACARVDLQGFDIVETANIPYAHLAPLAARAELRRIPLIVTWYELWGGYWRRYVGWRWPLYALTEALAAQLGDACVVLSDLTGKRLARARRRVPRHPGLLPGGIPLARIRAAARGGEPGAPLAYAGRLLREKRLDLLLVAVARLDAPEDRPLLTVIGDGPDAPRLHQLAAELGLGARVRFLGKLPSSEEVWRELGTARVAVQPSSREGFGLFPLEAMALGLPVVYCASPESAVGELVRDGIEGRQVASDPAALATELATLLADETRRAEWSAAASARAQHFDWSAIADKFEQLCYDLLEPTASGHGS